MVVIVFGLPGSGKTFFAEALAKEFGAKHYNTDLIRKETVKSPSYLQEEKMDVYKSLLSKIRKGTSLVLDGTFYKNTLRESFAEVAKQNKMKVFFIEIKAGEDVIRTRVKEKRPDSDADYNVYLKIRNEFEEMKEDHLVLWSDKQTIEEMKANAVNYISAMQ